MRVLLNGRPITGSRTGIGWYTIRLAEALQAHDQVEDVGIALGGRVTSLAGMTSPGNNSGSRVSSALKNCARHLLPANARRMLWNLNSRKLRRQAARWDLFHETNYIAPDIPMPLVTTVCDMSYLRCPEFMPRHRRRWLHSYLGDCLSRSRAIISISRFTTEELLNCFPKLDPSRVITTPLGVDHQEFHARHCPVEETRLRSEYGLPPHFLLYLGTLEPRKNLQGLLRAYALLPEQLRREYPLVLAGCHGWRQAYFRDMARSLLQEGSLKMLGYVPQTDVPRLMRAADVFCFPSLYEGFGLPALEAAACGTPVLCAGSSSLPEVLGEAAESVDPHSDERIAGGLLRVLEDDGYRTTLASRGPERASMFTWQRCAEATVEAYRRAA